jgi:hypothetical protein
MRGVPVVKDRFESKYEPVTESGCWIWTASSHARGYGLFYTGRGRTKAKMELAHRVSYELYNGVNPEGYEVCHKCDIPSCVNPDHLFLGSHTDNMRDMIQKGRYVHSKLSMDEATVIAILEYPANTKETAKVFSIDAGHCSRIRNFKIKSWLYLKERFE